VHGGPEAKPLQVRRRRSESGGKHNTVHRSVPEETQMKTTKEGRARCVSITARSNDQHETKVAINTHFAKWNNKRTKKA
jgi:hypothetical protein